MTNPGSVGTVASVSIYLSPDQIEEVNALMDDHWERRMAEGGNIRMFEAPLSSDPEMTDDYLIN